MKMKHIFRSAAVLSAAAVLLSASGCADTTWSFRTEEKTLSSGAWILHTYSAFYSAVEKYEEESGESFDAAKTNMKDLKIEGKDASEWIAAEAEKTAAAQLTMEKLVKELKIKVDETKLSESNKDYKAMYNMYQKDIMETLGVSVDTYCDINARGRYLSTEIFKALYGKGGTQEVTDEQLKKYYTDNYVDYYYLTGKLTTTNDDGETESVDDETKDKIMKRFGQYATMLNGGKTIDDMETQYKTDFEVETVPSTQNAVNFEKSTMNEELKTFIKGLDEKKAGVTEIDGTYYMVYKRPISEKAEKIREVDDTKEEDQVAVSSGEAISRYTILQEMKSDDFKKYQEDEQAKITYEINNDCLNRYTVGRTIDIITQKAKDAAAKNG